MLRLLVFCAVFFSTVAAGDLAGVADHYTHRYNPRSVIRDYITNDNLKHLKRMKVALDGVLYWGGGDYGTNPLGRAAIEGLCDEGFSAAIYVYGGGGSLRGANCASGTTDYLNILYSSRGNYKALERYLRLVKERIDNPDQGPIYLHCWNGIHASSQMAATALIQFCGISHADAVKVFRENSEGTSASYPHVARGIQAFKPYPSLAITPDQKRIVCNTVLNSL